MTQSKQAIDPFYSFFQRISPENAEKALPFLYAVLDAWENGHAFVELNDDGQQLARQCVPLIAATPDFHSPLLLQGNRLFLHKIYALEQRCAARLTHLSQDTATPSALMAELLDSYFDCQHHDPNIAESNRQQQLAAALALINRFLLISGGPGTGKTTTVAKIVALLCHQAKDLPRIALTAPTGKAAAHLQQSLLRSLNNIHFRQPEIKQHLLQLTGKTIHRLLDIRPPLLEAKYNQNNKLPYDIVIVDESSMIDLSLMDKLLNAVGEKTRLILLGDKNQLPSVGAGAVLAQISLPCELSIEKNNALKTILPKHTIQENPQAKALSSCMAYLNISRRFDENSGIGQLSSAILNQQTENAIEYFTKYPDELLFKQHKSNDIFEQYFNYQQDYWQAIQEQNIQQAFDCFYNQMVLCVLRYDTEQFNQQYLKFLSQKGYKNQLFNGKALLITQNNPVLDIYNGDIGIVMNGKVHFPTHNNEIKSIDYARLGVVESAFAITVHKSQGSEYNHIIFIAPQLQKNNQEAQNIDKIFDRSLLYTAVTRAKKQFMYIGHQDELKQAIGRLSQRRSALRDFLSL